MNVRDAMELCHLSFLLKLIVSSVLPKRLLADPKHSPLEEMIPAMAAFPIPHFSHFPRANLRVHWKVYFTCSNPLMLGHCLSVPEPLPFRQLRVRRRYSAMPSKDWHPGSTPAPPDTLPFELKDESDFDRIVSPDGLVSICGFGSLLSERSARSTFPDLLNFRTAKLNGFRRVFAHVAPIFFEQGIAKPETKEISSLSVEPYEGETLVVTTFEIERSEIPSFIEREHEFRFLAVTPETFNGLLYTTPSVLCARYSDEEYFLDRCKGSEAIFFQNYGKHGITKIWVDDILPCRVYLRHCVLAAKNLCDLGYDNFLDHTFLADRTTTLRMYLATRGSGIMEEEPPEHLKYRYGG